MPDRSQCAYEFAPGVRCQMVAGHDEPYYPYLDYGQTGWYSDILSAGSAHEVHSANPERPPREEWTGQERKDTVESWPVYRSIAPVAAPVPAVPTEARAALDWLINAVEQDQVSIDGEWGMGRSLEKLRRDGALEPWHERFAVLRALLADRGQG